MEYELNDNDVDVLRKAGVSKEDEEHCVNVALKALEIARRIGADLDMEIVGKGALFHDLGKARTHGIKHGIIGAEMGKELGLPVAITDIMEKHIRGGLTSSEAKELDLPEKDYSLKTLEEKVVIYADRLVDIITEGIVEIKDELDAETRFVEILKEHKKYGKNETTLNRYINYHNEIQGLR